MKKIELYEDGIGFVEYIQHMGTDLTIVNSARVSFGKEKHEIDEKDKKLIDYLISHHHTSTLEHCSVTFRFVVPLFVRSQHPVQSTHPMQSTLCHERVLLTNCSL